MLFSVSSFFIAGALAQTLSDEQIALVYERKSDGSLKSWEIGTQLQTILEHTARPYSVFSKNDLPPPQSVPSELTNALDPFFEITRDIVTNREEANGPDAQPPLPLMPDGSAADPASIGFAVLLANWTNEDGGQVDYATAAQEQLDFLLTKTPRAPNGAISHRVSEAQLWSDFVFMVPPFLAYYGALTENRTLLEMAHDQVRLYREVLRDGTGMWQHVLLGASGQDTKHWTTGNGWAAAGALRVQATIKNSKFAGQLKNQQQDLKNWVSEIHDAIYPHLDETQIFRNWADDNESFYDAAGGTLIAATVYRHALLNKVYKHIPQAEQARLALGAPLTSPQATPSSASIVSATTSSAPTPTASATLQHFDGEGWLTPVVNPHWYGAEGSKSAEGQAFVIMMQAAFKDWQDAGSPGENSALKAGSSLGLLISAVVVALLI